MRYCNVLMVKGAMGWVKEVRGLGGQSGTQGLMVGQHGVEILGLLCQSLHLLSQGCVLFLQVLTLQVQAVSPLSLPHPALLGGNPVLFPPHHSLDVIRRALLTAG